MATALSPDQEFVNGRVLEAANAMYGMSTRNAETHTKELENGNLACAYSVNKVLDTALGRTYGENREYVPSVVADLRKHGQEIAAKDVQPGDIAVRVAGQGEAHGHIGFVVATGDAPQILSNSSRHGSFALREDAHDFGRNYAGHGEDRVEYFRLDPKSVDMAWARSHPVPDAAHALGPNAAPPDPTHWSEHRPGEPAAPAPHAPAPPHAPAAATQANALPGIRYGAEITAAANANHIDPVLLGAVAAQETGGPQSNSGSNIVGDHGHGHGLMQIDDRWHSFASTPAAMDPAQNAAYAAKMLRDNIDRHHGDVKAALHDYNAGPNPAAESTKTTWPDGHTLSYEDSVLRHETNLRAALTRDGHPATPLPNVAPHATEPHGHEPHPANGHATPATTDYTRPNKDRILGETRDGKIVETKHELDEKNAILKHAEADARAGKIDNVRFVGDGHESAREVARQNEKLWQGIERNLPTDGKPPVADVPSQRDGYKQSGTIVKVEDGIVTQNVGRGRTAAYPEADFNGAAPQPGAHVTVTYQDGQATANPVREPLQRATQSI